MEASEKAKRAKAILKAKKEAKEEITKTAEVPEPLTPIEKAKALRQKCDSQYASHIHKKLLPGLK